MLGTNDTKKFHYLTPFMIAKGLESLLMEVARGQYGRAGQQLKMLVISPVAVDTARFDDSMSEYFDESSAVKASELSARFRQVAEQNGCEFLDASQYARPSVDGIHLGPEGHAALAAAVAQAVRSTIG
jgi:lysophospholipase L1-like esterase